VTITARPYGKEEDKEVKTFDIEVVKSNIKLKNVGDLEL
jgi:hypothetical protein